MINASQLLFFKVEDLDLESAHDFLLIYDGSSPSAPVLARLSKAYSLPQLITSSQNRLYIYFYSNYAQNGRGFSIVYKRGKLSTVAEADFFSSFLNFCSVR